MFLALYLASASLYPGGTQFNPELAAHDHFRNYFCDLLRDSSYVGHPNPGRPFAVAASLVLVGSLVPFWWRAPRLLSTSSRRVRLTIRGCGLGALLLAPLIATPMHDLAIVSAASLGTGAMLLLLVQLTRAGRGALVLMALPALASNALAFSLWRGQVLLEALPIAQKLAFVLDVTWILTVHAFAGAALARPEAAVTAQKSA